MARTPEGPRPERHEALLRDLHERLHEISDHTIRLLTRYIQISENESGSSEQLIDVARELVREVGHVVMEMHELKQRGDTPQIFDRIYGNLAHLHTQLYELSDEQMAEGALTDILIPQGADDVQHPDLVTRQLYTLERSLGML